MELAHLGQGLIRENKIRRHPVFFRKLHAKPSEFFKEVVVHLSLLGQQAFLRLFLFDFFRLFFGGLHEKRAAIQDFF